MAVPEPAPVEIRKTPRQVGPLVTLSTPGNSQPIAHINSLSSSQDGTSKTVQPPRQQLVDSTSGAPMNKFVTRGPPAKPQDYPGSSLPPPHSTIFSHIQSGNLAPQIISNQGLPSHGGYILSVNNNNVQPTSLTQGLNYFLK